VLECGIVGYIGMGIDLNVANDSLKDFRRLYVGTFADRVDLYRRPLLSLLIRNHSPKLSQSVHSQNWPEVSVPLLGYGIVPLIAGYEFEVVKR
jgi:hypothetical protein